MKTAIAILLFAFSLTPAYGHEPSAGKRAPASGAGQADASGARLKQLLGAADEMEKAGKTEQATEVRQKAHQEREALFAHIDSLQSEIERLRQIAGGAPQVMVHLKMYEVSMTKLRRLGYNLAKLQGKPATSPNGAVLGFSTFSDCDGGAAQFLGSLCKNNLAKVLAEPSLVTLSGQSATFIAGGRILLPQPRKDGTAPLEWRQYGTQVQLTPHVLGDHAVRLSLQLELSSLDYAHSVQVGKESYPGLDTNCVTTSLESQDGQTVVLGGLNQVRVETSQSGVPIASSIPYIGSAFKTVKEERNETAIFVLVRTEIAQPATANPPTTARQPNDNDSQR
jgi:Flp pilus assembly secretin CpaC